MYKRQVFDQRVDNFQRESASSAAYSSVNKYVEWVRAVCARLGGIVLSGSVLCAPGSVEKACCVRPCGVGQARWKSCGCCGSTDVLADERKNNLELPAGVITRLFPEICMERGSSVVVTLQMW